MLRADFLRRLFQHRRLFLPVTAVSTRRGVYPQVRTSAGKCLESARFLLEWPRFRTCQATLTNGEN